jgi:uncharacterized repeat protein (TIGR02543 family)
VKVREETEMTKKNIAKIVCALAAAAVVSLASCSTEITDLQNLKEKAKTVTLTFKADGGNWSGSTKDMTLTGREGAELTAPATPAKTGYTFSAWNPALPTTFPSADTTYTATWTAGTGTGYKVEHYQQNIADDNYTIVTGDTQTLAGTTDEQTAAAAKAYAGFTAQAVTQSAIAADGSTVVKICYTRNIITLTFKADGGTWADGTTADKTVKGKYGAAVTAANPVKAGYDFSVWNPAVPATFPSADTTYTATWIREGDYTITYSNMENAANSASNPAGYNVETATITLASAAKTGYTFAGWYSDSGLTAAVTQIAKGSTGAVTLYAKWTANTYTVKFDANTGSGTMTGEAFTYDTEKALTACGFLKKGYSFAGWNTAADGSGTSYAEGASVKNLSAAAGGTVTLYAKWTANTDTAYKVEYYQQNIADDNYTLAAGDTQNLTGTTGAQTAAAAKTYTGFTAQTVTQSEIAADGNTVVKIYYTRNIITLTFKANGGNWSGSTADKTVKGKYGAAVTVTNPVKEDYAFEGWDSTVQTTFTADATYTAVWKSSKQLLTFSFTKSVNTALTADVTGTVDQSAHTVAVTVPYGTTVTALVATFTCSEGASVTVGNTAQTSGTTENNFTNAVTYTVTAEDGSTQTYAVTVTVMDLLCEKVYSAPALATDSYGTSGTYVYFGVWPQTIKADGVNVDTNTTKTMGAATYYLGSDGYWYAKVTAAPYNNATNYTFTDGTPVTKDSVYYFKVEPIKWRVLETGKLLAESILANVAYYPYQNVDRTIGSNTVYPNNYKESRIRAYLNGLSYTEKSSATAAKTDNTAFSGKGFLQTAFTDKAQASITPTTVDNTAASTTDADSTTTGVNGDGTNQYACDKTSDNIYLLSLKEVTDSATYKFGAYTAYDTLRRRTVSDYARATGAYMNTDTGNFQYRGWWWLRSPNYYYGSIARDVNINGYAYSHDTVNLTRGGVVPALSITQ